MVTVNHNYLKLPGSYLFRVAAQRSHIFKQSSQMSGLCKNLGIILRKTKLTLITGSLLLPELRQLSLIFAIHSSEIWIGGRSGSGK